MNKSVIVIAKRRAAGFTLTEILIAVAIIAIISTIAMPLYTQYSIRTYRTEAQADLLLCTQGMERLAAASFSYLNLVDTDGNGTGDADTGAVSANICAPKSTLGAAPRYTIAVQNTAAGSYQILALPIAGTPVATDGRMRIDSNGSQFWDGNDDGDFDEPGEDSWHGN